MASQNLFDLILSDAPIDPLPTAQYQVTTSVVSTPRASDDNILPATSVVDVNNDNSEKKPASWDLTAFEAPQPSVSQTSSSEKQQAADDLSDFFGTPVPASTPQQRDSPNPQHSPQKRHVNDDFFSENFSASPKEVSPIQKEQIVVHEPQSVRESPPIAKQNNNQSTISSNADPHVGAKEVKRDDGKTVVNKSGHIDNEILNKFVKELEEQHSNNMKKIVTIMKENAAHAKELVIDKCHSLADSNLQLERRLKELEEQNKQLVTAVKNLQSQNKTLTTRLSKYEDVSQLETPASLGSKIIGFFTGK
jgi:hypothetical protein